MAKDRAGRIWAGAHAPRAEDSLLSASFRTAGVKAAVTALARAVAGLVLGLALAVPCASAGGSTPGEIMTEPAGEMAPPEQPLSLWYRQPARQWSEALPPGNGRLGAMVFGGVEEERIQFNEDTLWTGRPHECHREGAMKFLPQIRQLLQEGRQLKSEGKPAEARQKQKEAETLADKELMSEPLRQKAYQPFGDVRLLFSGPGGARLTTGVSWTWIPRWPGSVTGLATPPLRANVLSVIPAG